MTAEATRQAAETSTASALRLVPALRPRLADVLYGQLLQQIASGGMAEGDRLPSEAEIGRMFGASRPVVRQALLQLRADGLIQARKGAGSFVRRRPSSMLTAFAAPADVALYLRSIELRFALEGEAARLAALRRSEEQLAAIEGAVVALDKAIRAGAPSRSADLAFHDAVAVASGNELFVQMLAALHPIMLGSMAMGLGLSASGDPRRRLRVVEEHRRIAQAIAAQDAQAAELLMRFHLLQTRARTTDAREPG